MVFGSSDENIVMIKVRTKRDKGPKKWSLAFDLPKFKGRDPFNQNSNRSDREKRTTSKGGPVFSKLFRLDEPIH